MSSDRVSNGLDPMSGYAILLESNYIVPALWYSAFALNDLRTVSIAWSTEGNSATIPILSTPLESARRRVEDRRSLFIRRFSLDLLSVYNIWSNLLATIKHRYLLLEAIELYGLDPDSFADTLIAGTRAWDQDIDEDWDMLLAYVGLRADPVSGQACDRSEATTIALLGYPLERPS
jgi:hypothetical protein